MSDARKNDYGFAIVITLTHPNGVVVDISGATTKEYMVRSPSGTVSANPVSFVTDGTDGKLTWTVPALFLNAEGTWLIQAHVTDGATYNYQTLSESIAVDPIFAVAV